jgi:hypothetical protein
MGLVQFPMARSSQNTLFGIVFSLAVARVVPYQPVIGQESCATNEAPDPQWCKNINETLGIYINVKYRDTLENAHMR